MGAVRSMTGFGSIRFDFSGTLYELEIRSVNNRYLKLMFKLPSSLSLVQEEIRKAVSSALSRGSVDVFLRSGESNGNLYTLSKSQLERYETQIREALPEKQVDIATLLLLPGVASRIEGVSDEEFAKNIRAPLDETINRLNSSRAAEGQSIVTEIKKRLDICAEIISRIAVRAPEVPLIYMDKLRARIRELLNGNYNIDIEDSNITREVAFFADRADITEEIVRFNHHCDRLARLLDNGGVIGKECDFVVQEMNREANTLGSKCSDLIISDAVISLKTEVEKIREQVQNIE